MTDTSKPAVAAVVKRLRERGTWMRECGHDDDAEMDAEAASLISALEAERDKALEQVNALADAYERSDIAAAKDFAVITARAEAAEAQVATLRAKLENAAEALEPFAKGGAAVTHAFGEALFPESSMAFPSGCTWSENGAQCVVTWGDFRRARSTLSTLRETTDDQT